MEKKLTKILSIPLLYMLPAAFMTRFYTVLLKDNDLDIGAEGCAWICRRRNKKETVRVVLGLAHNKIKVITLHHENFIRLKMFSDSTKLFAINCFCQRNLLGFQVVYPTVNT